MKQTDWRKAMLNEAEASGNAQWATETRKATSYWRMFLAEEKKTFPASLMMLVIAMQTISFLPVYGAGIALLSQTTLWLLLAVFLGGVVAFLLDEDKGIHLIGAWAAYTALQLIFDVRELEGLLKLELYFMLLLALIAARLVVNRISRPL